MGSSGPQSDPCSPGAGTGHPAHRSTSGTRTEGLVCLLLAVKGVLYFWSSPVAFQVYCTLLQLRDSDQGLMPYSMYRGTTALYGGLLMFSGFLFHSFPSFFKILLWLL